MIAIRPPSNQKPYDEYWSGDSAFQQPDTRDLETVKIHHERIKQARKTGDWTSLTVAGRQPTKFVMQPLRGDQLRWIHDRRDVSDQEKLMGDAITMSLAFRCAVIDVGNLGFEFKIAFVDHPHLGRIADTNIVNLLDASDPSIVSELGMVALWRARELDPL